MAIITKAAVSKGSPATFTLSKSNLAAHASVSGDAYFSDQDNWDRVIVVYRSDIGNQKEVLNFDASLSTPTDSFLVSATARDIFQVRSLTIVDHDGGTLVINRANLTTAEFDVDMTPAPATANYRYFRVVTSSHTNDGLVLTELQLKWGGVNQVLSGASFNYSPAPLLSHVDVLYDGVVSLSNSKYAYWYDTDLPVTINVDLGAQQEVTHLCLGCQDNGGPKATPVDMEVFGSNDGINYTSIIVLDAGLANEWTIGVLREFPLV